MGKFDNYMSGSGAMHGGMPGIKYNHDFTKNFSSGYGGRTKWICSNCGETSLHYYQLYLEHRDCKECGGLLVRKPRVGANP